MDCLIVGIIAVVAWGLGVLFGRRIRSGGSAGVPAELHPHDHDEPLEDVAKPHHAETHHHESDDEKAHEFRDMRRTFGDG